MGDLRSGRVARSETGHNMGSETGHNMGSQTGHNMRSQTGHNMRSETGHNIKTRHNMGSARGIYFSGSAGLAGVGTTEGAGTSAFVSAFSGSSSVSFATTDSCIAGCSSITYRSQSCAVGR